MNIRKIGISITLSLLLSSCAGIGISNSSDPYRKLDLAIYAMHQQRYLPANKLILEAIDKFKKINDKAGLADAYAIYGNYHKYQFRRTGLSKNPNTKEALRYYKKAIKLFTEVGDMNGVAKTHMGMGSATLDTNKTEGCKHYDLAISLYDKNGSKFPINPNFKTFPEMVKAFKDKFCR